MNNPIFADNLLILMDSYKAGHWRQIKKGTQFVQYYFESRGGKFPNGVVYFGGQYVEDRYLTGQVVTPEKIREAKAFWKDHFGRPDMFNESGWEHVLRDHDGRLAIEIKAVPEGTVLPSGNALFTVENTCPDCVWIPGPLETILVGLWHPCTVATVSRECKRLILKGLEVSGDPKLIDFKLHDFGGRGAAGIEAGAIGGAAHLINFKGTDTPWGIRLAQQYYNAGFDKQDHHERPMYGFSIDATEHSTTCSYGRYGEPEAVGNMLDLNPKGMFAAVADSYDMENFFREITGKQLKQRILSRDGVMVGRPDSGSPPHIVPQCMEWWKEAFGGKNNEKGFWLLDPHVAIIQGDGINYDSLPEIIASVIRADFSMDNLAFGMGAGLHTKFDRDYLRFAMKQSWALINGQGVDVFKSPKTDMSKASKAGRLKLIRALDSWSDKGTDNFGKLTWKTVREDDPAYLHHNNQLQTVFYNGEKTHHFDFETIRTRAALPNSAAV